MVAVRILVTDASDLAQLDVRVGTLVLPGPLREGRHVRIVAGLAGHLAVLLREVLARQQEHLLVEAADDGNFRLRRLLLRLSLPPCRCLLLLCRVGLLGRAGGGLRLLCAWLLLCVRRGGGGRLRRGGLLRGDCGRAGRL